MPTDRFLKLPEEKRRRILEAAFDNFCRCPASKVSINNIIREAGISRGSFYTYFTDKTDVLMFLVEKLAGEYTETMTSFLDQTGGDPFMSARHLYEILRERMEFESSLGFLKNVFIEPGEEMIRAALGLDGTNVERVLRSFAESMDCHINHREYPLSVEQLKHLLPMLTMDVVHWSSVAVNAPQLEEQGKKCMEMELNLLKYGAFRREKGEIPETRQHRAAAEKTAAEREGAER